MAATPSGTTTQFHPTKFYADEKLHMVGTSTYLFRSTHTVAFPASSGAAGLYGPFRAVPVSTLRDCIQIPVDNMASRLGMFIVYDLAASSDTWPVVAVRVPPAYSTRYSPDNTPGIGLPWAAPHMSTNSIGTASGSFGTSTLDSGWRLMTATASYSGATSAALTYSFGPLDASKWAIVAASSGDQTDKYQPYFEFVFGMSSNKPMGATSTQVGQSTGVQWTAFSTSGLSSDIGSSAGLIFLLPFEMP